MLLAVMGRGVQRFCATDPADEVLVWHLTSDLEVCDENGAHLAVRTSADDNNPHCLVGGGELNMLAAAYVLRHADPEVAVFAYGGRSPYLESLGAPSESEVMSNLAQRGLRGTEVVVWPRDRPTPPGSRSNTRQEIANVFQLAVSKKILEVTILTVSVHLPRCMLFARYWAEEKRVFEKLKVSFSASEDVLLASKHWDTRVARLQGSRAFGRTAALELRGIGDFLAGRYK